LGFYLALVPAVPGGAGATPCLDVVWEQAVRTAPDGIGTVPDDRPGSAGHCGIDGLCSGTKAQKGKLREQLADSIPSGALVVLTDGQIVAFCSVPTV